MKHQKTGRKFGRETDQRRALKRTLMNSLIKYERIRTTEAKAKEIRPQIEKLVTKAKKKDLANIRVLAKHLPKDAVKKLTDKIAPKYETRQGGYTRIIKIGPRRGDAARMAIIEFV